MKYLIFAVLLGLTAPAMALPPTPGIIVGDDNDNGCIDQGNSGEIGHGTNFKCCRGVRPWRYDTRTGEQYRGNGYMCWSATKIPQGRYIRPELSVGSQPCCRGLVPVTVQGKPYKICDYGGPGDVGTQIECN